MASIFNDDNDNVPKEGTGKKKEDMDELKEIWRKQHPLMHTDEILSPERPKEQLTKERAAATTTAIAAKELFKKGGKKKKKGGRKKRNTRRKTPLKPQNKKPAGKT